MIQLSISMLVSWPVNRTLSGATTPDLSGPGSDNNKGVLRIPQNSSITGDSPSDCLMSYPGHSLGEFYSTAEKQLGYSTTPADWAIAHPCIWVRARVCACVCVCVCVCLSASRLARIWCWQKSKKNFYLEWVVIGLVYKY